ncbi:uncharacterized protein [Antedon mediterranea]|uniref:uncharacterized protein isoform X2 n=1 Tax=Antedon mediterranea TaxID=105859 RepID=UPI003AF87270
MDNVHVAIRVRPLITRESSHDTNLHWKVENSTIYQVDSKNKNVGKPYTFDYVFHMGQSTNDVYSQVAEPIIESAMDGYDGTIFAYGQTSSGKTFTMQGNASIPGIIPKAIQQIFNTIDQSTDREYLLRVCYMELYNEVITDLLCKDGKGLNIREQEKRVFVSGLTEEVVNNADKIIDLLKKGDQQRHVGRTNMNEHSSRSHTIFCIVIESRERTNNRQSYDGAVKVSRLNLVDLAGSERINETKAEGVRLKEACNINKSLFVLGQVINKLSSGSDYIPFRDSKLTRILQPSLGGNAKTAIICTVTPAAIDQTHNTLQFASRAKTIKNKPEMHEILSDEALLRRYKSEIENLKKQIDQFDKQDKLKDGWQSLENEKRQMAEENQKLIEARNRLETMVISGQGESIPKSKKRPNRRETWCPGTRKFPLLASDPIAAAAAVAAEVGSFDVATTFKFSPKAKSSISSCSVSSDEFSDSKFEKFAEECSGFLSDESIPKKKRRRAVHFSEIPPIMDVSMSHAQEIGCQTENVIDHDVASSHEELKESIIICEALMQEKDELKSENELMHQQILQLKEENQEINTKYITMEIEGKNVKKELSRLTEEFMELKEFTSIEQEVTDTHYKDIEIKHQSIVKELNQTIEGKEKEIGRLRRSICIPIPLQPSSDQTGNEESSQKMKELEMSLEDAEAVLMDTNKALSEMKDINVVLEKEMESLKKRLQQLENEKSDFQVRGEEVHIPENTQHSVQELHNTIERLTKESVTLKEDLQLSITSSVEIQEDLINCQEELEQCSDKCKKLKTEVLTLHKELECSRKVSEERVTQPEVSNLQDQEMYTQEIEALNSKILALQEELECSRKVSEVNQPEVSNLQDQEMHTQEIEALNSKILALQEELECSRKVSEVNQPEVSNLQDQEMHTQEIEGLNGKILALQEELECFRKASEERVTQPVVSNPQDSQEMHKQEIEALNGKILALQEELECSRKASEEGVTQPEVSNLQEMHTQGIEALNSKILALQEELDGSRKASEGRGNEREVSTIQEMHKQEIEALNSKILALQEELDGSRMLAEERVTQPEVSNIQNQQMHTQEIKALNSKILALQDKLQQKGENAHEEELEIVKNIEKKTTEDNLTVLTMQETLQEREKECETQRIIIVSLQKEIEQLSSNDMELQEKEACDINGSNQGTSNMVLQKESDHTAAEKEHPDKESDIICNLQMQLNVKTNECETLNEMVVSLLEQLEKDKEFKESAEESDLKVKVIELERRLELSRDYEVELESQVENLRELTMINEYENPEINSKETLMDVAENDPELISERDTTSGNKCSEEEDISLDESENITSASMATVEYGENRKKNLESKVTELQVRLEEMTDLLTEMSKKLEHSEEMLKFSKDYEVELERQLEEANKSKEQQMEMFNRDQAETESKLADMETKVYGSEASYTTIESKLTDAEAKLVFMESNIRETEAKFAEMESKIVELKSKLAESEVKVEQWKVEAERNKRLIAEQSMSTDMMTTQLESYRQTADRAKGALLAESNRELDQQRKIETLENAQKESVAVFQQASKEKDEIIAGLEKKTKDLLTKLRQTEAESDQATHRSLQMERESQDLRDRVKELENHAFDNRQLTCKQDMDPAKLAQRLKQVEFNLDITKQKADKFEKINKELKDSNKKFEANEFKANDLEKQLRDVNFEYERHRTQYNRLKSRYDNIVVELADIKHKLAKSEMKNAGIDTDKMRNDLCTLEKESIKLKDRVSLSDKKILQLENRIAIDDKDKVHIQDKMKSLQDELQYNKTTIQELQLEKEHTLKKMEQNEKHFNSVCQELENELTACKKLLTECQEQLQDSMEKEMKFKTEIEELNEEKENVNERLTTMEEELEKQSSQHEQEINTLQEDFMNCVTKMDAVREENNRANERIKEVEIEAKEKMENIQEELAEQSLKHQQEMDTLQKDAMKYMAEMANMKEGKEISNDQLREELTEAELKIENIEKELADQSTRYEQELKSLQEDGMKYMTEIEQLKEEKEKINEMLKEQIVEAEKKLETNQEQQEKQSIQHQQEISTLQEDFMNCMSKKDALREENKRANERIKEVEIEAKEKMENIQEELAEQSLKHQQEMDTLQGDAMKYMAEMANMKEGKEISNDQLREELTEAELKIENIEKELADQSTRYEQELKSLQEDGMKYMTEIEQLKEEKEKINEMLKEQIVEAEKKLETSQEQHQQEISTLQTDSIKYMTKMEMLKEEKDAANVRQIEDEETIERVKQEVADQSIRYQQEINTLMCSIKDLQMELTSLQETNEAAEQDDWALSKVCNDLKLELEEERQQKKQMNDVLKQEQDKCSDLMSKHDLLVSQLEKLKRSECDLEKLCDQIQEEQEEEERKHKETKEKLNKLEEKYSKHDVLVSQLEKMKRSESDLEKLCDQIQEEQEEEERKHQETKEKLNKLEKKFLDFKQKFAEINAACEKIKKEKKDDETELKKTKTKLAELEATVKKNQYLTDVNALKALQQELLDKKMKIVSLESEILKCTDPLEKRISQLTKELADSFEKVESWKNEVKRLRRLDNAEDGNTLRRSEAGSSGSGIIQECAVFTLKAEKSKLELELKKSKHKVNDLEKKYNEKSMFYQEEITRNTRLRAELKRYVEKVSRIEKFQEPTAKDGKRPLNDIPTNSPVKKAAKVHTTVESLPKGSKSTTLTAIKKTKPNDWDNFLQPAIEQLNEEDNPKQCTQQ